MKQLDSHIYDLTHGDDKAGNTYGSVFNHVLVEDDTAGYQYVTTLLLDSTSQSVAGVYGAQMNAAILRRYLVKKGLLNADAEFNLKFV